MLQLSAEHINERETTASLVSASRIPIGPKKIASKWVPAYSMRAWLQDTPTTAAMCSEHVFAAAVILHFKALGTDFQGRQHTGFELQTREKWKRVKIAQRGFNFHSMLYWKLRSTPSQKWRHSKQVKKESIVVKINYSQWGRRAGRSKKEKNATWKFSPSGRETKTHCWKWSIMLQKVKRRCS